MRAPAEPSRRNQHPGLHREEQGPSSYICARKSARGGGTRGRGQGTALWPWANRHVTARLHSLKLFSPSLAACKLCVGNDACPWGQLPRLVDLGQNVLRVFQHKGTFASITVALTALMPCSGHGYLFRGHWDSREVKTPACSVAKGARWEDKWTEMQYNLCAANCQHGSLLRPDRRGSQQRPKPQSGGKMKESVLLVAQILQWVSGLCFLQDFSCLLIPLA